LPKEWRPFPGDQCLHCGGECEVYTDVPEGYACDGDSARCVECGCPGHVTVEPEPDEPVAWVNWHDDPDCDCKWCQKTYPKTDTCPVFGNPQERDDA